MMNDNIGVMLAIIVLVVVVIMTVRALYGLIAWKGQKKKALIQLIGFPISGLIVFVIIAAAVPETSSEKGEAVGVPEISSERADVIAEKEAEQAAQAQAQAVVAELEECRQDLQCWGERYLIDAGVRCQRAVERSAQYDMRWTDGWTEPKFSRSRWENQDEGLITYIGDKAQFQNAFGAWQNVIYFCTYDPAADRVVNVEVEAGRLP